ncbi:hypothetical protein [Longitalea luteola]|uniref:hypothetical protein n=1 Tax=Longitalea luteola TaxID=2812563 RepID=UPI001A972337|nr:hypothetical protein [Longitalea luteola]
MSLTEKILFLSFGLLLIIFISVGYLNKADTLKLLRDQYDAALAGDDREAAIAAGQAYYRSLRGGELTPEDERIILKDVAHLPEPENTAEDGQS